MIPYIFRSLKNEIVKNELHILICCYHYHTTMPYYNQNALFIFLLMFKLCWWWRLLFLLFSSFHCCLQWICHFQKLYVCMHLFSSTRIAFCLLHTSLSCFCWLWLKMSWLDLICLSCNCELSFFTIMFYVSKYMHVMRWVRCILIYQGTTKCNVLHSRLSCWFLIRTEKMHTAVWRALGD